MPKVSWSVKRIVHGIEKNNIMQGPLVGRSAVRTKQYNLFERLKGRATDRELVALTNHPNGVVRCYSFWALLDHPGVDPIPIIRDHFNDTDTVMTQFGCVVRRKRAGEMFVSLADGHFSDPGSMGYDMAKSRHLDSLVLYEPNALHQSVGSILYDLPSEERYHRRVREIAMEGNIPYALIALARYRKQEDVPDMLPLIATTDLYHALTAISVFPAPAFFPYMLNSGDLLHGTNLVKYNLEAYYDALLAYGDEESKELVSRAFEVREVWDRGYHLTELFLALSGNIETLPAMYDTLPWRMWEEEKRVDTKVYRHLLRRHPERTLANARSSLLHLGQRIDHWSGQYFDDDLIMEMLGTMHEVDRDFYTSITLANIEDIDPHVIRAFIRKAGQTRMSEFVDPMLDYMGTTAHMYQSKTFMEALIAYQDAGITNAMLAAIRRNPYFNSEPANGQLRKFLEENGIEY